MKRFALLLGASAILTATIAFAAAARTAYAADKVDCAAVMKEVNSGKHAKDIAKDLNISTLSVYRCRKKAETGTVGLPAAATSPAASTK